MFVNCFRHKSSVEIEFLKYIIFDDGMIEVSNRIFKFRWKSEHIQLSNRKFYFFICFELQGDIDFPYIFEHFCVLAAKWVTK